MSPPRYRFVGRQVSSTGREAYVWVATRPMRGDSRHEQIMCGVDWFWNSVRPDGLPPILPPSLTDRRP